MYSVSEFCPKTNGGIEDVVLRQFNTIEEVYKYAQDPDVLYRVVGNGEVILLGKPIFGIWYGEDVDTQRRALTWWDTWDPARVVRAEHLCEHDMFLAQLSIVQSEVDCLRGQNMIFRKVGELNERIGVRMDIYQTIPKVRDFTKLCICPCYTLLELWNLGHYDWYELLFALAEFAHRLRQVAKSYVKFAPIETELELMGVSKLVLKDGFTMAQIARLSTRREVANISAATLTAEAETIVLTIHNWIMQCIRLGDVEMFKNMTPGLANIINTFKFPLPAEFEQFHTGPTDLMFGKNTKTWREEGWSLEMFIPLIGNAAPVAPTDNGEEVLPENEAEEVLTGNDAAPEVPAPAPTPEIVVPQIPRTPIPQTPTGNEAAPATERETRKRRGEPLEREWKRVQQQIMDSIVDEVNRRIVEVTNSDHCYAE